jgi:hypothetical protein
MFLSNDFADAKCDLVGEALRSLSAPLRVSVAAPRTRWSPTGDMFDDLRSSQKQQILKQLLHDGEIVAIMS